MQLYKYITKNTMNKQEKLNHIREALKCLINAEAELAQIKDPQLDSIKKELDIKTDGSIYSRLFKYLKDTKEEGGEPN